MLDWRSMRYTTYSRYVAGLLETLNLQALLDQLADFLLQSGFAGGPYSHPFWGEFGEEDPDRSLDALRQAILQALMDSGQLTPEMLATLRGEHLGRELPGVHQGLEDGLPQGVERTVWVFLAEFAPERMRVGAAGESRLQQEVGQLVEQ